MATEKKRISTRQLKSGMILADDAVTPGGQMLIPKGTVLTENHLFRMNLYQILSAAVVVGNGPETEVEEFPTSDSADAFVTRELSGGDIRLRKTEGFLHFSKVYGKVDSVVRNQYNAILRGEQVEPYMMLSSTLSLMNSVRLKSDLFNYMNHVRSDDYHTYVHAINVSMLSNIFGQWLKMSAATVEELTIAGMLHDIGKTQIPKELLNKKTQLSDSEFNRIRQHAQAGYDLIKHLKVSDRIKQAVLLHHERNDGSGYPFGFTREQIPDFAKIIAILDVYDAMTTSRSYHKKFSPFKVIQMFEQESYGYLDVKFLFTFLENIAHYYLGEEVKLNDGTTGKIVFIHNQSPSKPIIQTKTDMIDLLTTPQLQIEEIL